MTLEERREYNRRIMQETLAMIETSSKLKWQTEESLKRIRVFKDGNIPNHSAARYENEAKIIVSRKRTAEAAWAYRNLGRTAILDFASGTKAGGGARNGSNAQEESLCRISTLLPLLESEKARTYYTRNKENKDGMYSDSAILAPDVTFFRSDDNEMRILDESCWMKADVLVVPAPNLRRSGVPVGRDGIARYEHILQKRIEAIFKLASYAEDDTLILGAFGCGVFRNNPETVAEAFRKVQQNYMKHFKIIEYAVYAKDEKDENYRAFRRILS